MKKIKRIIAAGLCLSLVFAATACSKSDKSASGGSSDKDKTYNVGICQLVEHEALDAATKGFKDALTEKLGDKVTFTEQNAAGDTPTCATIIDGFVSSNVFRYSEHLLQIMQQHLI